MEDHILPPYYELLTRLLPDHVARNKRLIQLLGAAHDDNMVDDRQMRLLLKIYRQFMIALLTGNPDPILTEQVRDAFVKAVIEAGAMDNSEASNLLAAERPSGKERAPGTVGDQPS